jgi:hypothetical protein
LIPHDYCVLTWAFSRDNKSKNGKKKKNKKERELGIGG